MKTASKRHPGCGPGSWLVSTRSQLDGWRTRLNWIGADPDRSERCTALSTVRPESSIRYPATKGQRF